MKTDLRKEENVGIVTISGRLDASNEKRFKDEFDTYLDGLKYFVFDLSELEFIDSTGLGSLLSALKRSTELDGDIYITNLRDKPRLLFEITRAYKIFEIFDDLDMAVEEMKLKS